MSASQCVGLHTVSFHKAPHPPHAVAELRCPPPGQGAVRMRHAAVRVLGAPATGAGAREAGWSQAATSWGLAPPLLCQLTEGVREKREDGARRAVTDAMERSKFVVALKGLGRFFFW